MSNVTETTIKHFLIRDDSEIGVSVFVYVNNQLIFCENFDNDVERAKRYIKANLRKTPKVIDNEVYNFTPVSC